MSFCCPNRRKPKCWSASSYARCAPRPSCNCHHCCPSGDINKTQLRKALICTTPNIDPSEFQEPFKDGDQLPAIATHEGGDTEWLVVDVNNGSQTRAWLEPSNARTIGRARDLGQVGTRTPILRVQFAPGVSEVNLASVVASCTTGQSRGLSLRAVIPFEYRAYDGSGNNQTQPTWGAANEPLLRCAPVNYADGKSELVLFANPRAVSNAASRYIGPNSVPPESAGSLSDLVWGWGQFIDHEIDLTLTDRNFPAPITAPADDPDVPNGTIGFTRSQHTVDDDGVWQQLNSISSFLDATNVYGPSDERALGLRTLDGSGKLKTSHGGSLPPYNVGSVFPNANENPTFSQTDLFLCGDVRANENPLLCALHSLFVLEHNRLCDELLAENPSWEHDDERLFQEARRLVIGQMQHITVDHFLPTLFGEANGLPAYSGYDEAVRPDICTEFSTALYRIGHTMVSNSIAVRNGAQEEVFALADVFFNPKFIEQHGTGALLAGAAQRRMQEIDRFVVEALRNMLFGRPDQPAGSLHDLVAINLQRGADHGLSKYNDVREAYGLARKASFAEISSDADTQAALQAVYSSVDEIDLWIGALCEDKVAGAQVGELSLVGVREQFQRIRDGDRFWYENTLSADQIAQIKATTLADIIRRNTDAQVPDDVFHVPVPP